MIVLGRIVAPHGVRGGVKIHPFGDDPHSWSTMLYWWLGRNPDSTDEADWKAYKLESLKDQGKNLVASFDEVSDRGGAEALDGLFIATPAEYMPKPGFGEYYWTDLIGLPVVNVAETHLGVVQNLIETGAHHVLQLSIGEGDEKIERLIPFVGAFIKTVDLAGRVIRVEWEADW